MRLLRSLLLLLAVAIPTASQAAPITFVPLQGAMTVTVWMGSTQIANGLASLDSGFVVFDPVAGFVSDLGFTASNFFVWAPALPGAYNGVLLDSVAVDPAAGFSSSIDTTNPYDLTIGALDVSFVGSIVDVAAPVTVPPLPLSGTLTIDTLDVTIDYSATQTALSFQGVKLAEVVHNGVTYTVRGNIEFVGQPVPEPALATLALSGLAGLAWFGRRRA
jgi:hypothetical protein